MRFPQTERNYSYPRHSSFEKLFPQKKGWGFGKKLCHKFPDVTNPHTFKSKNIYQLTIHHIFLNKQSGYLVKPYYITVALQHRSVAIVLQQSCSFLPW